MDLLSKMVDAIYQTSAINYTYGTAPELLCELLATAASAVAAAATTTITTTNNNY